MSFPWAEQYKPKHPLMRWLDDRLPLPRLVYGAVGGGYPVPRNLNYFWNFGVLAGFCLVLQLVTALLLLSAASSSFQAGPGLLKALAGDRASGGERVGILPSALGRTNRHHTPYWGVLVFLLLAGAVTAVAGGNDQELVLFYAVSVFLSFLAGLLAMARFSWRERRIGSLVLNALGALVVAFTLIANLSRGTPIVSLVFALLIAVGLFALWVRNGRPPGIRNIAAESEQEE